MEEKTTPKIKILKQDTYKVKKWFVKVRSDMVSWLKISKLINIYQMIWYMQKL